MESTLMIIKVKYGDSLRRFSAPVAGNGELAVGTDTLKAKIYDLFGLPTDVDIIVTYLDEDGDVVTLVDDDDLRYLMDQRLKFLRLEVQLYGEKSGKINATSSIGNSNTVKSPPFCDPVVGLDDPLIYNSKSLHKDLKKLSLNGSPKALSSKVAEFSLRPFTSPGWSVASRNSQEAGAKNVSGVPGLPALSVDVTNTSKLVQRDPKHSKFPAPPVDFNGKGTMKSDDDLSRMKNYPSLTQPFGAAGYGASSCSGLPPSLHDFLCKCSLAGTGTPSVDNSAAPPAAKLNLPNNSTNNGVSHNGGRCDVCGAYTIIGSLYQSNVQDDYYLCELCFLNVKNKADYVKIDRPISDPHSFKYNPSCNWRGMNTTRLFDSQFILDITVPDGTWLAPSTPFTKVWRMRNNGSHAWSPGTQLVFDGGDRLGHTSVAKIELPPSGVPVGDDLDIAIHLVSPKFPGLYISYWRMASPSGVPFGTRFWVLIKVENPPQDSFQEILAAGWNLRSPSEISGSDETLKANIESLLEQQPYNTTADTQREEPIALEKPRYLQQWSFPSNGFPPAPLDAAYYATQPQPQPQPPSWFSSLAVDRSQPSLSRYSQALLNAPTSSEGHSAKVSVCRQVDSNSNVLSLVDDYLGRSDDACGEWDAMLEELQEMGFRDEELNKKMLKKHNGSMQRAVMEMLGAKKD